MHARDEIAKASAVLEFRRRRLLRRHNDRQHRQLRLAFTPAQTSRAARPARPHYYPQCFTVLPMRTPMKTTPTPIGKRQKTIISTRRRRRLPKDQSPTTTHSDIRYTSNTTHCTTHNTTHQRGCQRPASSSN